MNDADTKYQDINLPEGWVWCSLGEIAAAQPGFACGNKNVQNGLIHLRMNNIGDDCSLNMDLTRKVPLDYKIEKYLLKPGDLLFCHTNSSKLVGKNAIFNLNVDCAYSNHLTRLRIDPSIVSTNWLWCILTVYWKEGRFENECKNWVNQSTLPHDKLVQLSIPIPPILEQHLIVDRTETLLERVKKAKESLERIPQIMKHFRQAALKKAFSGELTAEWRSQQQDLELAAELLKRIQEERKHHYEEEVKRAKAEGQRIPKKMKFTENEPLDTSDLPELPESWVWTKFLYAIKSLKNGIYKQAEFYGSGTPCLRMYNIENAKIVWKNIHNMKLTNSEIEEYGLKPNDILINRVNSRELVGKAAIIPEGLGDVVFESKNIRMRVDPEIINPKLVVDFLQTKFARDQIEIEAKQTVGMATISQEDILEWFIPLPSLEEQREIVRRIESLFKFADETEKNAAEARKRVELMTQSILARAFRGDMSADFREAVRNWKDLDAEARGRYIFVLPEGEREKVFEANEFPMEPTSQLLERIREERTKMERRSSKPRFRGQKVEVAP